MTTKLKSSRTHLHTENYQNICGLSSYLNMKYVDCLVPLETLVEIAFLTLTLGCQV